MSPIDALNALNTLNAIASSNIANQPNPLSQFMSPAALAAAVYYNAANSKQADPINSNNASAYQRNYLEALRYYKAAYGSNSATSN